MESQQPPAGLSPSPSSIILCRLSDFCLLTPPGLRRRSSGASRKSPSYRHTAEVGSGVVELQTPAGFVAQVHRRVKGRAAHVMRKHVHYGGGGGPRPGMRRHIQAYGSRQGESGRRGNTKTTACMRWTPVCLVMFFKESLDSCSGTPPPPRHELVRGL